MRETEILPAVLVPCSLQVSEEAAVGSVPGPDLLHTDHLLVLDVEHEVAVGLLLLDIIVLDFHRLVHLNPTGHDASLTDYCAEEVEVGSRGQDIYRDIYRAQTESAALTALSPPPRPPYQDRHGTGERDFSRKFWKIANIKYFSPLVVLLKSTLGTSPAGPVWAAEVYR